MNSSEYNLIDKVYGNYISFQELIRNILSKVENETELNILEIGTGTGITTNIILNSNKKIKLTTIDIDKEMTRYASQTLTSFSNVNFIVSDALDYLKLTPNTHFDFIISGFTIHNFPKLYRNELYKEVFRTLNHKGVFINADKFVSDKKEKQIEGLKYRMGTYIDILMPMNKFDLLKEWTTHYIEDQQPNKLLKFDETINILNKIGFINSEFLFKSEIEMLGVLKTKKRD